MSDPRACRDPFPFVDHLNMAEVADLEWLWCKIYQPGGLSAAEFRRMNNLRTRCYRSTSIESAVDEK